MWTLKFSLPARKNFTDTQPTSKTMKARQIYTSGIWEASLLDERKIDN
jgi:hypothetical protein